MVTLYPACKCCGSVEHKTPPCWVERYGGKSSSVERLAKAVILFHYGGPWHAEQQEEWEKLTGTKDATTKNLCDFARGMLTQ
jgi:hypothetical protein